VRNALVFNRVSKWKFPLFLVFLVFFVTSVYSQIMQVGDVVKIDTQRDNQLIGYGLVVGLPQTGDSKSTISRNALEKVLKYTGIDIEAEEYKGKNIAAVLVTADIPPVARQGDRIDIYISSIGDAKSLSGGILMQTPLQGADGQVYAVAQGHVAAKKKQRVSFHSDGATTVMLTSAAIIEKDLVQPVVVNNVIRLSLRNFNIINANEVIKSINKRYNGSAELESMGSIELTVPAGMKYHEFLAEVLKLPVEISSNGKVVVDPATATIVMGNDVKISPVGITKNGITIKVQGSVTEEKKAVSNAFIEETTTVEDLVKSLNNLGLSAEDIIDIMRAIDAAGALHGELIIL